MTAVEDFLELILTAYVITAADSVISNCTSTPDVNDTAKQIVSCYCSLAMGNDPNSDSQTPATDTDCVLRKF